MFDTIQFLDRIERLYPEQEFNSTFRRATLSKDVSAVINMTALFGRIEDNDLFKDFERCIKSQDPSSIIRVMTELLSVDDIHADKANNFRSAVLGQDPAGLITTSSHLLVDYDITDVRSAVLGGDLTAILRLLSNLNTPQLNKVDLEPLEDLKASVTAQDPASIIRTLGRLLGTDGDSWNKYETFRKVVLSDNQYWHVIPAMCDLWGLDIESTLISDLLKSVRNQHWKSVTRLTAVINRADPFITNLVKAVDEADNIEDAMSVGQVKSKLWMIDKLQALNLELGKVFLLAGWYGVPAYFLLQKCKAEQIFSFDIDDSCWQMAERINKNYTLDNWKFKATTEDIYNINFAGHDFITKRANGTQEKLWCKPDTIICTSVEHLDKFPKFVGNIQPGQLCIFQSNNYNELTDHINCHDTVDDLLKQSQLSNVLYADSINLTKYDRHMVIGYK
jgi:hypothetical protein